MKRACLAAWLILVTAVYVQAGKTLQVEPLSGEPTTVSGFGVITDGDDCLVGNDNGVFYAVPNWIWGAETYTYLFDPLGTCGCDVGFEIDAVHMIVQFGAEDVPQSFNAYAEVGAAVWNDQAMRWEPGPAHCTGPVTQIEITDAGLYDIVLPVDDCGCMELVHDYAISFNLVDFLASSIDAVTDDVPEPGSSWNDYGLGWFDLVQDFGYPGNLLIWADADCCESPVAGEPASWGEIKSYYR